MEKKSTHKSINDIATDEGFIAFVKKGSESDSYEYWHDWAAKNPDRASDIEEAKQLVLQSSLVIKHNVDTNKLWDSIEADIQEEETKVIPMRRNMRWRLIGAAASIALLAFIFFQPSNSEITTFATLQKEKRTVVLPDGSEVILNSASTLSYDQENFKKNRKLNIEGEAFFKVEKGSTFTVETANGFVQVLGTQFNVYDRGSRFEVACTEGKVKVGKADSDSHAILTASESCRQVGQFIVEDEEARPAPEWQLGRFRYMDTPLSEVFAEMERQFKIEIKTEETIAKKGFNGLFTNDDLDTAMTNVTKVMGLQFEKNGTIYTISKSK